MIAENSGFCECICIRSAFLDGAGRKSRQFGMGWMRVGGGGMRRDVLIDPLDRITFFDSDS